MRARWPLAIALAAAAVTAPAQACTTTTSNIDFGSTSSYTVAKASWRASGSAGLSCNTLLGLLATHYIAARVDASTFTLSGPGGSSIAYQASFTPDGAPLVVGNFLNLSSLNLLDLLSGVGGTMQVYFETASTTGVRAGLYTGSMDVRWYYSVCSLGVLACLAYSSSPGLVRPLLGAPSNWGSGTPGRINIALTVEEDCIIRAPDLAFGAAPLVGSFSPITQTIQISCTAGASYSVGLDSGLHASGATRRMRNGGNYLAYEIYKGATGGDRWGRSGSERRSSASADVNAGMLDSFTLQGFTYRAEVNGAQATPSPGDYNDTVLIDIIF